MSHDPFPEYRPYQDPANPEPENTLGDYLATFLIFGFFVGLPAVALIWAIARWLF